MDIERIISDIESLEEMYDMPDIRPLNAADILAANQRHDKKQANSPWFSTLATLRPLLPKRGSGTPARRNRVLERFAVYSYQFRFPRSLGWSLPVQPDFANFQLVRQIPDIGSKHAIQQSDQTGARPAEIFIHAALNFGGMLV